MTDASTKRSDLLQKDEYILEVTVWQTVKGTCTGLFDSGCRQARWHRTMSNPWLGHSAASGHHRGHLKVQPCSRPAQLVPSEEGIDRLSPVWTLTIFSHVTTEGFTAAGPAQLLEPSDHQVIVTCSNRDCVTPAGTIRHLFGPSGFDSHGLSTAPEPV